MSEPDRQCPQCLIVKPATRFPRRAKARKRDILCRDCQIANKAGNLQRCRMCKEVKPASEFANKTTCQACKENPKPAVKRKATSLETGSVYYLDDLRTMKYGKLKAGDRIQVTRNWSRVKQGDSGKVKYFIGQLALFENDKGITQAVKVEFAEKVK